VIDLDLAVEVALALSRRFEGCRLTPYLCPAGIPTIGYGSTRYLDGTAVTLLDPQISEMIADGLLLGSVQRLYLPAVLAACPGIDSPHRLAAIIDFTYNLGASRLRASTLRKRINEGNWDQVPDELRKWTLGGGRRLKGLVIRREAEAALTSVGT
jgi:lysozyme